MEFGRVINYNIIIEPTDNMGFTVMVGCGRFSYSNKKNLIADLEAFLENPAEYEKQYNKTRVDTTEQPTYTEPQCVPFGAGGGNVAR